MIGDQTFSRLGIFTDPELASIRITAQAGQVIYEPQTVAEHVYYVQRGEVRLFMVGSDGECRLVTIMGEGDWFGAGALARGSTYGMRATSHRLTQLVQVRSQDFLEVLLRRPEAMLELNRDLAARLQFATEGASSLVFGDCNQRLIKTLVRFSSSAASTPNDDGVELRITHDQLAQAIGVARETVSVALTQLKQQNLLQTGRNKLTFNPEVLRELGEN